MFLAELEFKPDLLVVVNVAPPLFTQPALEAQARGANIVWINVPPMPEVKNALFVATDAFGMGQTGGEIVVAALEKSHGKPAAEITGDVVTAVCVPGLTVLENRLGGEVAYLKKKMPKINVLASFDSKPDRERNFALWDQAIRQNAESPDLYRSVRGRARRTSQENPQGRQSQELPLVSYDSPGEEVREDVARDSITAVVVRRISHLTVTHRYAYIRADSLLKRQAAAARLGESPACGRR